MRLSTSASNVEVSTKAAQLHCTEHDCLSGALTLARMLCPDAAAQALANRAFYRGDLIPEFRGDLLLAADAEHAVLRLRFDAEDPRKVVATERLLGDSLDGARTIGVGRDGAIYLCAAHTLIRLAPSRSAPGTP